MSNDKTKIIQILEKVKKESAQKTKEQKNTKEMLVFLLGKRMYAFDTKIVKEITKLGKIFSIPATPGYLIGAVNLRGEILPVINLKEFLELSEVCINDKACIIVVEDEGKIGFLVDSIVDIMYIPVSSIQPPLVTMKKNKVDYFDGEILSDNKLVSIFNAEKIMTSEEMKNFLM